VVGGKLGRLACLTTLVVALALTGTACSGDEDTSPESPLSVAEARQETRDHPDDPDAWKDLASALRAKGETNAAIPAAARLLSLQPKDVDAHRRLAVLYLEQGDAYQAKSQPAKARASFSKAVATYRKLVTLAPKNQHVRIELGQAAERAGDSATAISAYTAFLRLTPKDPNAPYVRKWLKRLSRS
jgi:tetratricopeptide (TPR) repeat protein